MFIILNVLYCPLCHQLASMFLFIFGHIIWCMKPKTFELVAAPLCHRMWQGQDGNCVLQEKQLRHQLVSSLLLSHMCTHQFFNFKSFCLSFVIDYSILSSIISLHGASFHIERNTFVAAWPSIYMTTVCCAMKLQTFEMFECNLVKTANSFLAV